MMKFTALLFTLFLLSQAYASLEQQQQDVQEIDTQQQSLDQTDVLSDIQSSPSHQDSLYIVEEETDELEKFIMKHVVPLYKHIKASNNLNLTIKAVLGCLFVSLCIRVCLNIINGKDQDKDLIKEIRDLKKQFKTLKEEKTKDSVDASALTEIKSELKSLRETLTENETNISSLLKEKSKVDGLAMDFQTEVLDSHKALWAELRTLKRLVSHRKPAGLKIPPIEKPVNEYCESAELEDAKAEPQSSLPAYVNTERKKSATVAPSQNKQSLFSKNRKVSQEDESGRQIDSAETKAEPDSGFPRQKEEESPSVPEAQTPMTQLIKQAMNTLPANIFDESPLKSSGDVFLTPKPLGGKRGTLLSSKKIMANSPRPLIPQSCFN